MAPEVSRVEFGVFVSNGGAHSGLLEAIGLIRVRWNGSKPFFDLAAQLTAYLYDSTGPAMPRVLEAGDGFPLRLQIAATDVRMDADEFARRLGEFQSLEFEVEWTFRRATPAGWSLVPRPWRRPRTTVSRAARFELDAQHFVVETLDFWGREGGPHERLAEIGRSLRGLP
jgi:hypothetical protein